MCDLSSLCRACGSAKLIDLVRMNTQKESMLEEYDKVYYGGALSKLFTADDYALRYCTICSHIQYEREFSEEVLAKMYEAHAKLREEKRSVSKRDGERAPVSSAIVKLLTSLKRQVGQNVRLLDYGAGEGAWSIAASKLGFDVVAYEPHSIRVSSSVSHVSKWCEIESEKFDVIICNQVLEHLNRPSLALKRLKAVSHKGTGGFNRSAQHC